MTTPMSTGTRAPGPEPAVRLRRATPADAEMMLGWRTEPSASRFQPLLPLTAADLRSLLAETADLPLDPRFAGRTRWIVEANRQPVGTISLTVESREHGLGAIGYGIGDRHRGNGYATDAVRALLPLAFSPDGADLWRLEAVAATDNETSRRVLERCSFQLEGIARSYFLIRGRRVDHARYAILREEWEQTRSTERCHSEPAPL